MTASPWTIEGESKSFRVKQSETRIENESPFCLVRLLWVIKAQDVLELNALWPGNGGSKKMTMRVQQAMFMTDENDDDAKRKRFSLIFHFTGFIPSIK
jgi:hypothetical protein